MSKSSNTRANFVFLVSVGRQLGLEVPSHSGIQKIRSRVSQAARKKERTHAVP